VKLLVGLGNPGPDYARHRHNVGFMAADAIAERHRIGPWKRKFQGLMAEGQIGAARVVLLKPQTWMNESGRAVGEAARFYRLAPGDVIVMHDELDLAPGKVRVKLGGGVAGHNGLRSIDAHLGSRDFWRVRIGIGHPGDKDRVLSHVLGDFAKAERVWLPDLLAAIAEAAEFLVTGDDGRFMNRVAVLTAPPPKRGTPAAADPA
jgi:PTH1 family peptidyl-tRNA hydrolase